MDGILSPNTASGIGVINTLITDDIIPILELIDTQISGIMDLTVSGEGALAKNMNCTFIKDILEEIYPDLKEVNEGMQATSYLSLSTILILLLLSLGSFVLGQCFHRITRAKKDKMDGTLKNSTNKIVPIDRHAKLNRAGTGDLEAVE